MTPLVLFSRLLEQKTRFYYTLSFYFQKDYISLHGHQQYMSRPIHSAKNSLELGIIFNSLMYLFIQKYLLITYMPGIVRGIKC